MIVEDCATKLYIGMTRAKKSQNPQWDESFKFDFCSANSIEIRIIHKKFGFDKDIGIAVIDVLKVKSSEKFAVPIKPLTEEDFTGVVYVSIKFAFPNPEEKKGNSLYLFATATFEPPLDVPPEAPMPVKFKCLAYDKDNKSFMIFDDMNYGFEKIISSGNKRVFTGNGFSQVYILLREELNHHRVLFLVQSDNYDGIVTINLGMKYLYVYQGHVGPDVCYSEDKYKAFKSFSVEIGTGQYVTSPIHLSYKLGISVVVTKVHDNDIMMLNPGEDPYAFEYNVALRLSKKDHIIRRNIVSSFNQMYLFPYLLQKSNNLRLVMPTRRHHCIPNAYVFDSTGSCIFGDEKLSDSKDNPIFLLKKSFFVNLYAYTKEYSAQMVYELNINLGKFSEPGTTIFVIGEIILAPSGSTNIDNIHNMPFLLIGDDDNDISFGKFPVLYREVRNHAYITPKKVYPEILFSLSFVNGEWIYTPINGKLQDLEKETVKQACSCLLQL